VETIAATDKVKEKSLRIPKTYGGQRPPSKHGEVKFPQCEIDAGQPCRALKRFWVLLIMYKRPFRRTTRLSRWRARSDFKELRTFMTLA
jgi:hypothetical protein